MAEKNKETVKKLGLDRLPEDQRDKLADYFAKRKEIFHENADTRKLFGARMEELARTKAGINEIRKEIIEKAQKDALERDIHEGYVDSSGTKQKGYVQYFHEQMEKKGVETEDGVKEMVIRILIRAIKQVPLKTKRKYRHEYARALIDDYSEKMEEEEVSLFWGMSDVVNKDDIPGIKVKTFGEWVKEAGPTSEEELNIKYEEIDETAFIGAKDTLESVTKTMGPLNNDLQEYFTNEVEQVKSYMAENPKRAQEVAGILLKEVQAAVILAGILTAVEEKITTGEDADLKKSFEEFKVKLEKQLEKFTTEGNKIERKKLLNTAPFAQEKAALFKKAPAEAADTDAPTGKGAEALSFFENPMGYLKKEHPWIFGVITFLGLQGVVNSWFSKAQKRAKKFGEQLGGKFVLSENAKKAKKLLKEELNFKDMEIDKLLMMKVSDVLKVSKPPPEAGIDKDRFKNLQEALKRNGAKKRTDETVADFIGKKGDKWKEPEKEPEKGGKKKPEESPEAKPVAADEKKDKSKKKS